MARPPWFVFAGGGTGGHLFPALAVVDSLRSLLDSVDISFFCTNRDIDADILGAAKIEAIPQPVQPMPSRPWRWPSFLINWMESLHLCRKMFDRRRPAAVIGAGGYASGPPVRAAVRMDIPTFLLNPDAVPGKANQHLARRGHLSGIFAQWEVTRKYFPPDAQVTITGCPVRPEFRKTGIAETASLLSSFDLDPKLRTLLVTGASQGARTINDMMVRLAGLMDFSGWQILHLAGAADTERITKAYTRTESGLQIWRFHGRVFPFTNRMADAMAVADLIVSRAGASSLAEIIAVGKPSILLPYPYHRDQHQAHNARVLVEAGAAVMIKDSIDPEINAGRMAPHLANLMKNHVQREAMAKAARSLDRSDSAERIARELMLATSKMARGSLENGESRSSSEESRILSRRTA